MKVHSVVEPIRSRRTTGLTVEDLTEVGWDVQVTSLALRDACITTWTATPSTAQAGVSPSVRTTLVYTTEAHRAATARHLLATGRK